MIQVHPGTGLWSSADMPTWQGEPGSSWSETPRPERMDSSSSFPSVPLPESRSPPSPTTQRHEPRSRLHQKRAADPKTVAVESPVGSKCWKIASTPAWSAWCARQELQKLGASEVETQQESTMDHFVAFVGKRNSLGIGMPPLFFGTSLRYINSLGPHWRFRTYHPRIALICIDLPLLGVDVNDMEC